MRQHCEYEVRVRGFGQNSCGAESAFFFFVHPVVAAAAVAAASAIKRNIECVLNVVLTTTSRALPFQLRRVANFNSSVLQLNA